jgi:arylamine N-acetyltransferase
MNNPDVHIISIVNVDGFEFIVDCGYAAPFLEPMPRNLDKDYILKSGNETYILKPKDSRGNSRVEQYYKDELKHFYIAKPQPRDQKEFQKVIKDSYSDEALFMNSLIVTRHSSDHSVILRNFTLTVIEEYEVKQKTILKTEIPDTINKHFGIPARLVKSAISGLRQLAE